MKSEELIKIAVKALDSKKARDIEVINVEGLTMLGDYLVIASGTSNTQVRSLAEEVEYKLSQEGIEPHHIEGRTTLCPRAYVGGRRKGGYFPSSDRGLKNR